MNKKELLTMLINGQQNLQQSLTDMDDAKNNPSVHDMFMRKEGYNEAIMDIIDALKNDKSLNLKISLEM